MSLPRIIKVVQCTEPQVNCWYEELIGVTLAVTGSFGDYYVVDEYEITLNRCIPLTIKKCDCDIAHY